MARADYTKRAKRTRGPGYTVEELRRMEEPTVEESHEVRDCPGCYEGLVYDTGVGAWVDHDGCSGSGRARAFVYPKAGRLRECDSCRERYASGDLHEVREDHESLTFFEGDMLCGACAAGHGVI